MTQPKVWSSIIKVSLVTKVWDLQHLYCAVCTNHILLEHIKNWPPYPPIWSIPCPSKQDLSIRSLISCSIMYNGGQKFTVQLLHLGPNELKIVLWFTTTYDLGQFLCSHWSIIFVYHCKFLDGRSDEIPRLNFSSRAAGSSFLFIRCFSSCRASPAFSLLKSPKFF